MNLWLRLIWFVFFGRFRSSINIFDVCTTPFMVLPTDLDVLWHVNNGRYLSILDIARLDLMCRSGMYKKIKKQQWYPVVTAETIYFKRALKLFDRFTVETHILGWDEKSIYLQHRFLKKDELIAQAVIQARFLKEVGGSVKPRELLMLAGINKESPPLPEWILQWSQSQVIAAS